MTERSYDDWEAVADVQQVYEAELIACRLREAGFEVQVLDQSFEQMPLPDVPSFEVVRVLVPTGKAEEARALLSKPLMVPEDAELPEPGEGDEPED